MISNNKFLLLLVLFNQMVSPVEKLELNSKLRALCKDPANAFNCTNPSKSLFSRVFSLFYNIIYKMQNIENIDSSKTKYVLPRIIIHKVNEFLPIRLSKKNYIKLKDLSNILYSSMLKSGYFAALKASAERLRAKRIDGKKVIVVQPIYHKDKQLPGYRLILEDDSQKIITRVDYSTKEKETLIYQTLIIFIENIYITPVTKQPIYNFQINSLQIINIEKHYKNPLPDEEIKEYSIIIYRILQEERLQFSAFV